MIIKEIKKFLWLFIRTSVFTHILRYVAVYVLMYHCLQQNITPDSLMANTPYIAFGMVGSFFIWLWFHVVGDMFDRTYPCYGKDLCEGIVERTYPVKVIKL